MSKVRVRPHGTDGDRDFYIKPGDRLSVDVTKPGESFIVNASEPEDQDRKRQPPSAIKDWLQREDDHNDIITGGIPIPGRRKRNRAAQLAFRERKEKHLKQLQADLENLELQVGASRAKKEELRIQIGNLYLSTLSEQVPEHRLAGAQETYLRDPTSADDHTPTKGYQQSEAFLDDPARSSTSELRPKSRPVSPSRFPSCSHESQTPCSQCLAAWEPLKSDPVIPPAVKAGQDLQPWVLSQTSALFRVQQPEWYIHANALTPPDTPTRRNKITTLDAFAAGGAVIPKTVSSPEVENERPQERHDGHHSGNDCEDEQTGRAALNDGGSVQQGGEHFLEFEVSNDQTRELTSSNGLAGLKIQPHARWTRIRKDLVDPRALDDGNEQYEEKTDYVKVFRVLTKEEIDQYTFKTQEIKKRKAKILEKTSSSPISDGDLEAISSKETPLTSASDEVEMAEHIESSRQDDSEQVEEKISTGNAMNSTKDEGSEIYFETESMRVIREQFHAIHSRTAKLDGDFRQTENRSILFFTILTVLFLPLSFFISVFGMNGPDRGVTWVLPAFVWSYKGLSYATIGACGVGLLHSYRNSFNWRLLQRQQHTLEELNYTFSTPRKHVIKWILRDVRQQTQSFFLSANKQMPLFKNVQPTVLSPMKRREAKSPRKQRIDSQCRCGYRFCDYFVEIRPMALAKYGESLQRQSFPSKGRANPVDEVVLSKGGDDMGTTRPQNSNWSSFFSSPLAGIMTIGKGLTGKENSTPSLPQYQLGNSNAVVPGTSSPQNELLYLLMCIPQHQYATKLLQPQISAIRSDQDFFFLLRNNYRGMRGRMRRLFSLKALQSIKFVQLEMYRSELVDIRKQDDLPPEDKRDEYRYNPVPAEMIPPVGENHMLHLMNHPTHAEEDGFVLDRIPKKLKERLLVSPSRGTGLGWGIYFIEGWHLSVVTIVAFAVLLAGSLAFLICWSVLKHDLQGASGVAAYIVAFLGLAIGSIQAVFELT